MRQGTPFSIGLAGPSCSGKTSIARQLATRLPGKATVFGLDSYYFDLSHLSHEERARKNFDHPDLLESELLARHLAMLRKGHSVLAPVYDFATHSRVKDTFAEIAPNDYLVVEGLFTLHWPEVRQHFDLRVFITTPDDCCLERRKCRDVRERGRTVESVVRQYTETVRPGNEQFVLPSQAHADLVIDGGQPIETSAQQIAEFVARCRSRC
jgi:uridine kinase